MKVGRLKKELACARRNSVQLTRFSGELNASEMLTWATDASAIPGVGRGGCRYAAFGTSPFCR